MKNIKIYSLVALFLVFMGCEDETFKPVIDLEAGDFVSAEFTSAATGTSVLNFEDADMEFEKFEWSSSDYGVSVPVRYTIEASSDEAFTAPYVLGETSSTSLTTTVDDINDMALSMGLTPFEPGDFYMRITSEVQGTNTIEDLVSTSIMRTVSAYVTEFEPIFMIGDAVKGWDTALAVEVYGTGPSQYSVTAEFNNGGAFRFFSAADWNADPQYNYTFFETGTVDVNLENAMDGDTNFKFVGTTGFYTITVNTKDLVITMEAVSQPELYIVGAGSAAGWDWANPVQFTWVQDGLWEVTSDFTNDAFRFFTVNGDWNSGRNYPYYDGEGYDIDDKLEDALDGDNNFLFNGDPGTYKIIVNEIEKTIIMAQAGTAGPPLYVVGDGTQAGWDWGTRAEAIQYDAGVYTAILDLNNAGAFRFFTVDGDWNSGRNHPFYVNDGYTIDANLIDAADGDNNFKFTGVEGTYKLVINENDKTITLTGGAGDMTSLWGVGDGLDAAGWAWDTPVEFMQIGDGVWAASTDLNAAGAFRFFTVYNDWNSGRNHPYYVGEGYTIDANLIDAADGDNNFKFTGTDGTFIIKIDSGAKTITLE